MNPTIKTALDLEQQAIDVVRALAMDGPHQARSGHQGTAMAMAPLAHVLFTRVLRYDAADPDWPDRDRFVLSIGHASILLYSMLHLTDQGLGRSDLEQFRQWGSLTPGHPEADHTRGVEVTTGPLGQGLANAVGMAIAERRLRAEFGSDISNHRTYVIAGDGDLSEGLSHEAASLAGHLGLGRLIAVYDDNNVTIDGHADLALSDDAGARFRAYGWHVDEAGEIANDPDALEAALVRAREVEDRPSLIVVRSHIGYPSPTLTDAPAAHGLAFGDAEIAAAKTAMGQPADEAFRVPAEVQELYREAGRRGRSERLAWEQRTAGIEDGQRAAWDAAQGATGLEGWESALPTFEVGTEMATRVASQQNLSALAPVIPALIGGSADLTGNTGTRIDVEVQSVEHPGGRQIHFGVREHAMAAILVGAARHGGVVPFGGTFLVFADYMRPAIRLASMSRAKCIFVWTHDSIGVGEDGPTHQPVEQLMSLRAIPGFRVIRPADATEVAGAWQLALSSEGPSGLILSRQNLPVLAGTRAERVVEGAYALNDVAEPDVILIGTGSEVSLCVQAEQELRGQNVAARVVSMPCWETFADMAPEARDQVLTPGVPTVSIEAGVTLGWDRYADVTLGIDRFGASAPASRVFDELGINTKNLVEAALNLSRRP